MKKSFFTKITMIAIIALISVSAKAETRNDGKFYSSLNGNTRTIYTLNKDGKTLSRKLKYEFKRDKQGNIIQKDAFKWNFETSSWKPYYRIQALYNKAHSTLHYAEWNSMTKIYDVNIQKSIYKTDGEDHITDYNIHKIK